MFAGELQAPGVRAPSAQRDGVKGSFGILFKFQSAIQIETPAISFRAIFE
jgi:hypothetical protein